MFHKCSDYFKKQSGVSGFVIYNFSIYIVANVKIFQDTRNISFPKSNCRSCISIFCPQTTFSGKFYKRIL